MLSISLLCVPLNGANSAEVKPNARSLELNESGVKAVKEKQFEVAEQLFHRALNVDSSNLTAAKNLSGIYLQNQKPKEALKVLLPLEPLNEEDPEIPIILGDAYFVLRDTAKARLAYERALAKKHSVTGVARKLASVCTLIQDFECAVNMLERAQKENPKDVTTLLNLASLYLARNEGKKAVIAAKNALQISPSGETFALLGESYLAIKAKSKAKEAFRSASRKGYKPEEMEKRIELITSSSK
jgi:cytochrome c-type biogenesis protein CcmH/NrfG